MIRGATLISIAFGALLAFFVFAVKYEVQDLEAEFVNLNRSIDRERQSIHVLTAEWSHLNEPARLRALARDQLGLEPVDVNRLAAFESLPVRDPIQMPPSIPSDDPPLIPDATPLAAPSASEPSPDDGMVRIEAAIIELSRTGDEP